jgi:hypothetical protein
LLTGFDPRLNHAAVNGLAFMGMTSWRTDSTEPLERHWEKFQSFRHLCNRTGSSSLFFCSSMNGVDFAAVRELVSMAEVLELLGFTPVERRGDQVRGPCPIHRSESPQSRSFSANLKKNALGCFSCGAKENQLDLWSTVSGKAIYEATIDLCTRLAVIVPWTERKKFRSMHSNREEEPVIFGRTSIWLRNW